MFLKSKQFKMNKETQYSSVYLLLKHKHLFQKCTNSKCQVARKKNNLLRWRLIFVYCNPAAKTLSWLVGRFLENLWTPGLVLY